MRDEGGLVRRWMPWIFCSVLVGAAFPIGVSAGASACDRDDPRLAGTLLTACVAEGQPVRVTGSTVSGAVDLAGVRVRRSFRCIACVFLGEIRAREAAFGGIVDLSGSQFRAPVDASGATFEGPLLIRATGDGAPDFLAPADFSFASMRGPSDFSGASFVGPADFSGADFGGRATFGATAFASRALFGAALFQDGASFQAATFGERAIFQRASVGRSLDFALSHFRCDLRMFGLAVGEALSFRDALFARRCDGRTPIRDLRQMTVGSIEIGIDATRGVEGRRAVLGAIERSATAAGDLSLANDAHFERLRSESTNVLDAFFYRMVAGYLVKPAYPALWLLGLLVVAVLARVLIRRRHVGEALGEVWALAWPRGWDRSRARGWTTYVERVTYTGMFWLFLFVLGKSFPPVREMIESLTV